MPNEMRNELRTPGLLDRYLKSLWRAKYYVDGETAVLARAPVTPKLREHQEGISEYAEQSRSGRYMDVDDVWRIAAAFGDADDPRAAQTVLAIPRAVIFAGAGPVAYHVLVRLIPEFWIGQAWYRERYQVYANLGYCCINLARFDEAIWWLAQVSSEYDDWIAQPGNAPDPARWTAAHTGALAYAHYRLSLPGGKEPRSAEQRARHATRYRHWLKETKTKPGFPQQFTHFCHLYPEIADQFSSPDDAGA